MRQGEVEAFTRTLDERRRVTAKTERVVSPIGITLIAWFQFLKAGVLLFTVVLLQTKPELVHGGGGLLDPLLHVATRGRYDALNSLQAGNALAEIFLILGLYLGAVGLGLLHLSAWARRTLILNCGLTLVLSMKSAVWPAADALPSPDMTNFNVLLALDFCVLVYLLRVKTAELFRTQR